MKYFKNGAGVVFAFEADGSQDAFIPDVLIPISLAEADELRKPPPEAQDDALARAIVDTRKQRAPILSALDGIAGRMYRAGDMDTARAADEAITSLLDITKLPELLTAATYYDMKAIVMGRYRQIADAAPAAVQTAFIEVVAS